MSKGLEALKFIQFADSESKEIIEKELKRLEELDNGAYVPIHINRYNELCDKEEALEIIKKLLRETMHISFIFLDKSMAINIIFWDEYDCIYQCKTKEEYDLLKEVLL